MGRPVAAGAWSWGCTGAGRGLAGEKAGDGGCARSLHLSLSAMKPRGEAHNVDGEIMMGEGAREWSRREL